MRSLALLVALTACSSPDPKGGGGEAGEETGSEEVPVEWDCLIEAGTVPEFSEQVGCRADFDALAADPLDASIPGAASAKTVIDRIDGNHLYFTNSEVYPIHYEFASAHLSGGGLPIVPDMGTFNSTEYYSPDRRFILGAVTWYEEPGVWVYEIAPYDTASVEMVAEAYRKIAENAYFGADLLFHPTSEAVEEMALGLPADVRQISTDELFAGITYQPLNLGTSMGILRFREVDSIDAYTNYREIVVLDRVPNDISVVAATVTDGFQTPLAHINVLAQNRGTPNMALIGAWEDPTLRALEDTWVELKVEALGWSVRAVTEEEADAWWEANRPEPLDINPMDVSVSGIWGCEDLINFDLPLREAITERVPAFGGKASHMGVMVHIGDPVPTPNCLAIPLHYYNDHMERNGLWARYEGLKELPGWDDPAIRASYLQSFQTDVARAPMNPVFLAELVDRIDADFDRAKMRFRSSTNAEDLGDFTGAGLYTSKSGEWDPAGEDISDAIRTVWASTWGPRAWEEREYWGIDHTRVGMALLSNPAFDGEEANGVAVTGNVYDTSGLEPAFYINVQYGEASVVIPEEGTTTDQILYYYYLPGQPVVYIGHSNLSPDGEDVLTTLELFELGEALDAIHNTFYPAYGTEGGFYAMDVEFKFDDGQLSVKQGRPYPGWSVD